MKTVMQDILSNFSNQLHAIFNFLLCVYLACVGAKTTTKKNVFCVALPRKSVNRERCDAVVTAGTGTVEEF
jgi:hypothetical protein